MKQEITAQVHMLPQNKEGWNKGELVIDIHGLCIAEHESDLSSPKWKTQHLYFISNNEIKRSGKIPTKGTWCYRWYDKSINNHVAVIEKYREGLERESIFLNEIIASTDPALGLPAIPLTWIRDVYVPSNGSIKEVKLKIDEDFDDWYERMELKSYPYYKLELTPDNEVIIVDEPIIGWSEEDRLKAYNDGKSSNIETYDWVNYKLPEKHGGLYTYGDIKNSYRKGFYENQELEDAANMWMKENGSYADTLKGFKAGANWKAEQLAKEIESRTEVIKEYQKAIDQSANDAMSFVEWVHKQHYEIPNSNIPITWTNEGHRWPPNNIYTTQELYELWQQNR